MPSILQLPPLYEDRSAAAARASANGNNGAGGERPALQLEVDSRLHKGAFTMLDQEFDEEGLPIRMREAFWVSVIVHGAVLLLLIFALPRLAARYVTPTAWQKMLMDHQLTFLEMPPSPQPKEKPQTDRISDQNRIAALRHPVPDAKTLQELMDSKIASPGQPAPPQAAAHPAVRPSPQTPARRPQQANQGQGSQGRQSQEQIAENSSERAPLSSRGSGTPNPFTAALSPGSQIQQAIRQSAMNHGAGSTGDDNAGSTPAPPDTKLKSGLNILSDTMGVDFGPYLSRVLDDIRRNWYILIPEEARNPLRKQGKVQIYFVIAKDGSVQGLRVISPSGDIALDRAALGGITESNPFEPLPAEFKGQNLVLACTFLYNPNRNDLR